MAFFLFGWIFFKHSYFCEDGFNSMDKLFAIQRFSSWLWGLGCNSNKYLWSTAKQQNVGNRKQMHGSVSVQGMISVYALLRNVSCEELQWVQHFGFGDRNGTNALEKHLPVLVPSLPSAQMVCGGGFFFFWVNIWQLFSYL